MPQPTLRQKAPHTKFRFSYRIRFTFNTSSPFRKCTFHAKIDETVRTRSLSRKKWTKTPIPPATRTPRYAEPRFLEIPQALKADRTSSGSHIPLRIYVVLDTQPTVMFRTRRQDNRQQEPFFSAKPLLMKDSHSYTGAIAEKSPPPILLLRGPCEEIFASVLYSDVSEQVDLLR